MGKCEPEAQRWTGEDESGEQYMHSPSIVPHYDTSIELEENELSRNHECT